jgi:hypothetical protein
VAGAAGSALVPLSRATVAQGPPPGDLQKLPARTHRSGRWRAARREPWWYCSYGDCRFDPDLRPRLSEECGVPVAAGPSLADLTLAPGAVIPHG